MKRSRAGRVVPTLVMTAATAVPILTTAEILIHASSGGSGSALAGSQPATPAATPTPTSSSKAAPTATSTTPARAPTATPVPATHTYVGPAVQDQFGTVQATITVTGRKIANVVISAPQNDPRSAGINSQAVPLLQSETLQAQSANVSVISGATETSDAYIQSLQGALKSAGLA